MTVFYEKSPFDFESVQDQHVLQGLLEKLITCVGKKKEIPVKSIWQRIFSREPAREEYEYPEGICALGMGLIGFQDQDSPLKNLKLLGLELYISKETGWKKVASLVEDRIIERTCVENIYSYKGALLACTQWEGVRYHSRKEG